MDNLQSEFTTLLMEPKYKEEREAIFDIILEPEEEKHRLSELMECLSAALAEEEA